MNRRGFIAALAGLIGAATLDPERLLWKPGARLISIPKPSPVLPEPFGFSIRLIRHYDIQNSLWVNRFDVLHGYGTINPKYVAQIAA